MPTKPVVTQLPRRPTEAGILKQLREVRGRRAQMPALAERVNLCEGKKVVGSQGRRHCHGDRFKGQMRRVCYIVL